MPRALSNSGSESVWIKWTRYGPLATNCCEVSQTMKKPFELSTMKGESMKKLSLFLLVAALTLCPAARAQQQTTINLGSAGTFAVLSGTTVTNTGPTVVNGNLGVWPGTAVTGFGPGVVNGTEDAGDVAAHHAQASLTVAYNDAAGRTSVHIVGLAGDISGQTLSPGLYKSTSTLSILGTLTLHGTGVYIFQIASGLTVGTGARVVLSGGATAANVFWQVGSSATLGTTSDFKGTILALTSISLATGATLNGRALAQHGAVTLDTNNVTLPLEQGVLVYVPPVAPPPRNRD
jgi:hypothetical protein